MVVIEEEKGCMLELAGVTVTDEGTYLAIFPAWSVFLFWDQPVQ